SEYPQHRMLEAIFAGEVKVFGKTMKTVEALKSIGEPVFVIEPGRSIAETSGVFLMKVTGIRKISGGHNLIAMDAGAVNYDSAVEKDYLMRRWMLTLNINQKDAEPFDTFVAGRLCYNGDIISRLKIRFPRKPREGDIVLVHDTGAYAAHFYAANTNSFARPSRVICYEDGSVEYIKKEDTYDEIFS
ncbi:MAG: decarboxylase, partial [Candidatus Krumholzibacteria bacterium]|nr:decarboxylase [Candidatus Krumholzibacteria bacterium]